VPTCPAVPAVPAQLVLHEIAVEAIV